MWPLSRKNNPKQFISIKNNHSIFQETVARNMAFCDEFIIASSKDYESIIENQMKAFRGLTYRCIYEANSRYTLAPIVLTAMSLAQSEVLFVVSSDHLISGESYKDDILRAKEMALAGKLVSFRSDSIEAGMSLFRTGDFINEMMKMAPDLYHACRNCYVRRITEGSKTYYDENSLNGIPISSIETSLLDKSDLYESVKVRFSWQDVGSLDDLDQIDVECPGQDQVIDNKCENTTVINQSEKKLVLVNHLKDVMVVNTDDAIYIGNKGDSNDLKEIIHESKSMWGYFDRSSVYYRTWGEFRVLESDVNKGYQVRKVTVLPGRTIGPKCHSGRSKNLTVVSGKGRLILEGVERELTQGDYACIPLGSNHQISCMSYENLVFIETDYGSELKIEDFQADRITDVPSARSLGYNVEPFYKLKPAFKDYLWGGTKLRDSFNKQCDYDQIAESWELSAHPDGQSIVASGDYRGLTFGEFLTKIGDESLGWKYSGGRAFPLLIKLIDARENLSIQVHPDDEYALDHENEYGKSELWYILEASEGACLYVGFREDTDRESVRKAVGDGSIMNMLNRIEVKKGESYYIPAGTVHAIGSGCLICEVQQSSNSTYRLYDYDRIDKYGHKRQLDIDKALDVLDYSRYTGNKECKYFDTEWININDDYILEMNSESFKAVMVIEGKGCVCSAEKSMDVCKGDMLFLPKSDDNIRLKGRMSVIIARL